MAFNSPFVADNATGIIRTLGIFNLFIAIYTLDLRNIKGWINRKLMEAKQRKMFEYEIRERVRLEKGLGYDKATKI
jgi:hypothetical protein